MATATGSQRPKRSQNARTYLPSSTRSCAPATALDERALPTPNAHQRWARPAHRWREHSPGRYLGPRHDRLRTVLAWPRFAGGAAVIVTGQLWAAKATQAPPGASAVRRTALLGRAQRCHRLSFPDDCLRAFLECPTATIPLSTTSATLLEPFLVHQRLRGLTCNTVNASLILPSAVGLGSRAILRLEGSPPATPPYRDRARSDYVQNS